MSDDPQSEQRRSRLLNERKTLIKAQNHLQRVLGSNGGGGNAGADDGMRDMEPKEATDRGAVVRGIKAGRDIKTEVGPAPQTPETLSTRDNVWQRGRCLLEGGGRGSVMNTALDRDLGGLGARLLFVSSDGVFLLLFLL
jgi:hypothetical protein